MSAQPSRDPNFEEIRASGPACPPPPFPPPLVRRGVRVDDSLVVDMESGTKQICSGVVHAEDLSGIDEPVPLTNDAASASDQKRTATSAARREVTAYWPYRKLQDTIYGSIWCCLVLSRHYGKGAEDATNKAAGVERGSPVVWEKTGKLVTIKMVEWEGVVRMRGRLLEDPTKEVSALQWIGTSHPNVLGSSEVLQDDKHLYSVMPHLTGGSLFEIVVEYAEKNDGEIAMPEPVARFWFRQILEGIKYLQARGICHRDLSLENVLVDENNTATLIDLGMCIRVPFGNKEESNNATQGQIRRLIKPQGTCGKHNYMAPEIYKNKDDFDGFAVDLWSAGVILYIMLAGFPPYDQACRSDARFEAIASGRMMKQLENWGIQLSKNVGDLLQKMLQLHPQDRLTLTQVKDHPWVVDTNVVLPKAVEDSQSTQVPQSTGSVPNLHPEERGNELGPLGVSVYHLKHIFLEKEVCGSTSSSGGAFSASSSIAEIENLQGPPGVIRTISANTVCKVDSRMGASYVHCLSGVDHVGKATHMLSYSWSYTLGDIVDTLCMFCQNHSLDIKRTYIWIDCLCINQHRVVQEKEGGGTGLLNFEQEFPSTLRQIGHMLAMMTPWNKPKYLTRIWCVFELYTAHVEHCNISIIMPPEQRQALEQELFSKSKMIETLASVLSRTSIQNAEASVESDRQTILNAIKKQCGYLVLNNRVNSLLLGWTRRVATGVLEIRQQMQQESLDDVAFADLMERVNGLQNSRHDAAHLMLRDLYTLEQT